MLLPQMLRSEHERDFVSALRELSSMPKNEAVAMLEQLALESDGVFRSRAIDGMVKVSPKRAETLAFRFLNDPEWFVRCDAIRVLWLELKCHAAAPLITQLLGTDPNELVRSWSALALGSLGDSSVIPALEMAAEVDTGTDHEGVPIRETALHSIKIIRSRIAGKK